MLFSAAQGCKCGRAARCSSSMTYERAASVLTDVVSGTIKEQNAQMDSADVQPLLTTAVSAFNSPPCCSNIRAESMWPLYTAQCKAVQSCSIWHCHSLHKVYWQTNFAVVALLVYVHGEQRLTWVMHGSEGCEWGYS